MRERERNFFGLRAAKVPNADCAAGDKDQDEAAEDCDLDVVECLVDLVSIWQIGNRSASTGCFAVPSGL